jgi:hypothetical protein
MESHSENTQGAICPSCEGTNEEGSGFCVHCGSSLLTTRRSRFKKRHLLFAGLSLILIGITFFFWINASESKLVGKVNGEGITLEEFSKNVDRLKKFYENRYGQGIFEGEGGKGNLNRLKTEILDEIITEKILLQEAKIAGYTSAPEGEIEKRLEALKKQFSLADADLKKMGRDIKDLKVELQKEWITSQFIQKAVLKGNLRNPDQIFDQWLAQAKSRAKIETYEKLEPVTTAKASCCKSGCGGGSTARSLDPKLEQEVKAKGLEYYEKKTQKKGANARVTNFGCHIQVDIIEEGKVALSLTYRDGEVQEI